VKSISIEVGRGALLAALLLAASLWAGCSADRLPQAPTLPTLPSGQVVLATFSGEVDPVAGTVTIDTQPTSAPAPPPGLSAMVITEGTNTLSVSIVGATWNGTVHSPDCGGLPATGADIKLTPGYQSPVFMAGVYAEITAISSGTGLKACDVPSTPPALANTSYGYWYYGTITPGAPVVKSWNWLTAGGGKFKFSGRLVGVTGTSFTTGLGAPPTAYNHGIARLGNRMVYAVATENSLQYVALDGSSLGRSPALPAPANSVAGDAASGLVWFTTLADGSSRAWAGYVNTLNESVVVLNPTGTSNPYFDGIVVDPDPETGTHRAWFYSGTFWSVYSMTAGATPTFSSFLPGFMPSGLAFPSAGSGMLVAYSGGDQIQRFARDGSPGITYSTLAAGCGGPQNLVQDGSVPTVDGLIWFSGSVNGAVCSLSAGGVVTKARDVPGPSALAFDGGGSLWAISTDHYGSGSVHRVTPAGGAYALSLPVGVRSLAGIAYGPDLSGAGANYLWVGNGPNGLVRLQE
jgi:sugar lactone lactonase YvrE